MRKIHHHIVFTMAFVALSAPAQAQSLFQDDPEAPSVRTEGDRSTHESIYATSLIAIKPPDPREYHENDLVTIEVSEISNIKREQTLETDKKYELDAALASYTLLKQFLQLKPPLTGVSPASSSLVDVENKFEGEGEYERKERVTARITARVLEVKPNGSLLIEARTTIQTDKEKQTILLAGLCRSEDITANNTISSSQLFDLTLNIQHEGQVKDAAKKGLIPIVFDAIFNF
jgi:flagellar L-ring protein precursor FlgH